MITFYPFRARINKSGIYSEFIKKEIKLESIVNYFLADAFNKSGGSVSEDIIYYLCLEYNTILFRINSDMELTGMYFDDEEIINSWNHITNLIIYLFNTSYQTVLQNNSLEISENTFSKEQISSAAYITDTVTRKYINKYIPVSFIAGKDASVFYQPNIKDIDYPLSDDISCYAYKQDINKKTCIPFDNKISETEYEKNDTAIFLRVEEAKKKSILQIFKGKKEDPSDFLNKVFIKTDKGDVLLKTVIDQYSMTNEPDSFLFRLDKIAYTSGGNK